MVGEYGPDAGTNSATRGPAGDHRVEPRHQARLLRLAAVRGRQLGRQQLLPLHVPERPVRRTVRLLGGGRSRTSRRTTPACRASPARPCGADVWHKRTGEHPARFAIPAQTAPQESITGPIYRYDASNPSTTKWPAYYDGAWFILDRSQNWWRETRVKDDGSGILRVNGLFGSSQFGSPSHTYPIPVKFGPDGALYMATWGFDCCRAQLPTSQPGRLVRVDFIADEVDTTAPVVDATVTGSPQRRRRVPRPRDAQADRERQLRRREDRVLARRRPELDDLRRAGRRSPRAAPTRCSTGRPIARRRRTRRRSRQVDVLGRLGRRVPAGAVGRVQQHAGYGPLELPSLDDARLRRGGPDRGRRQPRAAARGTTRSTSRARVRSGCSAQPLPTGDFTWSRRSRLRGWTPTSAAEGSRYAQVGLKLFQTNDNWIKVAHTRNADGGPTGSAQTYFEIDLRERTARARSGTRMGLAAPATNLPTWWMRDRPQRQHDHRRLLADRSGGCGGANWVALSGSPNIDTVMPAAAGPRYIGAYGGNGSITARYDYIRFTPDNAGRPRGARDVAHAGSGDAGRRRRLVPHAASRSRSRRATRASACRASTVPSTASAAARSRPTARRSASAATATHTVEYRSTDKAGNAETAKAVDGQARRDRAHHDRDARRAPARSR